MAARNFCFTINNYTELEEQEIRKWKCRYVIGGYEVGESGTPHIQGYIEFREPHKLGGLKKLHSKAHWEIKRGTREEARKYCMKEGKYFEEGDWKSGGQGKRTDLKKIVTKLEEGERATEIILSDPETASRNLRWLEKAQEIIDKKQTKAFRKVRTIVLTGKAGCGKTKYVHENNENVFTVNPEDSFPFDGYDGEKVILIDDFYGNLKYTQLLRVLDGHQLRINIKGGHRYARWTKVYITSNEDPDQWYTRGLTDALKRRLTKVTKLG